ncbi:MAG: hypothetical protein M1830_008284 [Pleopsidium flavum]|nr:MAG: hypothetical protein M1830_008284 [Pleopsidium flavum]
MSAGLNSTELNDFAPAWVSEPNGRGTWKIIYSCCFTLSLCVVTAIHLNVGPAGENTFECWRRKCKWVIIAILSPEIILYTAGKQWFSASRLCKKLNKLAAQEQTELPTSTTTAPFWSRSETPSKAIPLQQHGETNYSLLYGYFVTMGGFIVDVSHLHNTLSRLTISPKGVAFLAKHGHFVKISDATIRDKSKADMLAKALVCVQVSWMLVQTISRRIVGYPITLLEVHTLVHVACAIGMYGLWFQKPLDIRDPAWINASEFEALLALMLVRNYGFGTRVSTHDQENPVPIKSVQHKFSNGSESAYLHVYPTSEKDQSANATVQGMQSPSSPDYIMQAPAPHWSSSAIPDVVVHHEVSGFDYSLGPSLQGQAVCTLISGQALACGVGPAMSVHNLWGAQEEHQHEGHLQLSLTSRDVRRWTLAARASRKIGEELYHDSPKGSVNYFTFYPHSIFLDRKGLQAGFYAYFCAWASGGLIAALIICMFYGAAHATAWKFVFPTDVERLLWRIACIDTIAGVISLLAIFSVVVFLHEHGYKLLLKSFFTREPGIMSLLYRVVILIGILNFPFFILSRIYIIIETFISLRRVQLGVYQTVQWTDYIPHL